MISSAYSSSYSYSKLRQEYEYEYEEEPDAHDPGCDQEGWAFFAALASILLVWGLFTRSFGLIIPGGVLGGIGLGIFLTGLPANDMGTEDGGLFMIGFAAGWALISLLSIFTSDRLQWWPLIPGGIMAAIGAALIGEGIGLSLLTVIGYAWPLALVAARIYILVRRR